MIRNVLRAFVYNEIALSNEAQEEAQIGAISVCIERKELLCTNVISHFPLNRIDVAMSWFVKGREQLTEISFIE